MSVHRSRLSSAVPDGPVPAHSKSSGLHAAGVSPRPLSRRVFVGMAVASLSAQFPPPARPPKMGAQPPAAKSQDARPAQLPSARTILDKHLAAIGGRQAVLSHKSTHATGTLSMPAAGVTGAVDIYGAHPNRTLLKVSLGGVGEVLEGFDGTHGWSISPMTGPMLLEGKQLEEKRFDSEFHSELRTDDRYVSLTTLEQGRFRRALLLQGPAGPQDRRRGHRVLRCGNRPQGGQHHQRETQMGTVTGTTVETDYKKFGNLLQPTTVRSQVGGLQQVITITSVDYDNVPASMFELPPGIKALAEVSRFAGRACVAAFAALCLALTVAVRCAGSAGRRDVRCGVANRSRFALRQDVERRELGRGERRAAAEGRGRANRRRAASGHPRHARAGWGSPTSRCCPRPPTAHRTRLAMRAGRPASTCVWSSADLLVTRSRSRTAAAPRRACARGGSSARSTARRSARSSRRSRTRSSRG